MRRDRGRSQAEAKPGGRLPGEMSYESDGFLPPVQLRYLLRDRAAGSWRLMSQERFLQREFVQPLG